MADEFDNAEYERLQGEKASNEQQQAECQSDIDRLEAQIEEMKKAYAILVDAKSQIKDIRKSAEKAPGEYDDGWKGNNIDNVEDIAEGSLESSYTTYINDLDEIEDSLNWDINHKKEELNDKKYKFSYLVNLWDDICTCIGNLFN